MKGVFELDKQTINDLAIFPIDADDYSVFNLFNKTSTLGGRDKLIGIFKNPLTNTEEIEQRINAIKYLQSTNTEIEIDKRSCDYIEFYLTRPDKPTSVSKIKTIEKKVMHFFSENNDFYVINKGVEETIALLKVLDNFSRKTHNALTKLLENFNSVIRTTLDGADFIFVKQLFEKKNLAAIDIARCDHLFRYLRFKELKTLLDIVYQLDVFTTVGKAGKALDYNFPQINSFGDKILLLKGLYHPFIKNPVANHIEFYSNKNICFVTGANMAGKSTFLKSVGIAVYLSQLGFPVPAAFMETSTFEGLITTINLADNIKQGSSHFYTEVSRVKHVAQTISRSQNVVVIFDELFRGTNVKDAFDASLSIIKAFSRLKESFFIVSTHIVEVANELTAIKNITFKFMETTFDNGTPKYSYRLQDGITEERLGMWIVDNEGIIEIIDGIIDRESNQN
jgi:DNA mismatch repair protein MutS